MDFQDAEKLNCSSKDIINSVSKKWKFYFEVRRREDGFDPTPSYIPRRLFPNLLPRPMLMQAPQDVSLKHHFTHAQVRSALGKIQSYQPHSTPPAHRSPRGEKIHRNVKRILKQVRIDHPMWDANQHADNKHVLRHHVGRKPGLIPKNAKPIKKSVPVLLRATPPYISDQEKQRLLDSTCELILGTEGIGMSKTPYMEMGNTKLQNQASPTLMQYNFTAPIHRKYIEASPRTIPNSAFIRKGKSLYIVRQPWTP
uniref:Uncharacterized protein n=1 Tax=Ciona savignyi TaxID=51511 RepID=H2ZBF3_CIOSA